MISQTAEYALRAVVCLGQHHPQALTTRDIAGQTRVPAGYLSKVLQALGRDDIVQSQRGLGGGWALSVPPKRLTILRVVNAVDPLQRIHTCPLDLKSHGTRLCPLHRKLDDALASIEKAFAQTTIDHILRDPARSTPLCEVTVRRSA